jgi:LysR family glycine cleavage system transcriptional activator
MTNCSEGAIANMLARAAKPSKTMSRRNGSAAPEVTRRRLPPLKSLLVFDAAARHANFTRAAVELAVTPSAISHQIQALEDFLGEKLFVRQSGHVWLTNAGRLYHHEIEAAIDAIADATHRVSPQSESNALLILSSPGLAEKWLQPRLPFFIADYPDVRLRVATVGDPTSFSGLRFDVAIFYGTPSITGMNVEPFMMEKVRPLCSPTLASELGLKTLSDLGRTTLIHSANVLTWDAFFRRVGIGKFRSFHEIWLDRSSMAIEAAVAGLGVVLESDILTETELKTGQLVAPFDDEQASVPINAYYLVTPPGFKSRQYCVNFAAWLFSSVASGRRPPARQR